MRAFAYTLALFLAACSASEQGRVLLIGLDGADMELAGPLMAEGRLPHLARLADEGTAGLLESAHPFLSPRVWTTIATGKTPDHHGIGGWVYKDADGQIHLYESVHRRGAALWNIASDAGLTVTMVNWLMTYPPEVILGVVVTDHALPKEAETRRSFGNHFANELFQHDLDDIGTVEAPVVFPTPWRERLLPMLVSLSPLTHPNPFHTSEELKGVALRFELSHFFWNDQRAIRVALELEEALHPDIMMVLLQGIDRVSHSLWGTLRPETAPGLTEAQRQSGAEALRHYYEISDALVGKLSERYGSEDLVMVVSDHGFEYVEGKGTHAWGGTHETDESLHGIFFARGPGVPAGHEARGLRVRDVTPTILTWLGLPVARDMDGRPAEFLEQKPSWTETYDDLEIQRVEKQGTDAEAEILRQLEALGYIESD